MNLLPPREAAWLRMVREQKKLMKDCTHGSCKYMYSALTRDITLPSWESYRPDSLVMLFAPNQPLTMLIMY